MKYALLSLRIAAGIAVLFGVLLVSHLVSERFRGDGGVVTELASGAPLRDPVMTKMQPLIVEGESINALAEKLKKASSQAEYEPGEKAFGKACELLAGSFFFEAEEKLKDLVKNYPFAPSVPEARRILGQRNIDRFLSDSISGGKKFHKVQGGDSYYKIARDNETTLDNLMMLNGLYGLERLHKGEELLIMPLHFNLVVDIANRRLTLEYGKVFVKDYPFKTLILPKGKGIKKTLVRGVHALTETGKVVNATSSLYRGANKIIELASPVMEIVGDDFEAVDGFQGAVLERALLEELAVLLRKGNLVEIRY